MGVYFQTDDPVICIGFSNEEGWGFPVFKRFRSKLNTIPEGKLTSAPYEDDGVIWFDFMKNGRFNNLKTSESQIRLLRSLFVEVMETVANS